MSNNLNQKMTELIKDIADIRLYSSCGVMKGVMVRDNEKAFDLVMKARDMVQEIKENEHNTDEHK